MEREPTTLSRRRFMAHALGAGAGMALTAAEGSGASTDAAPPGSDWPMYRHDPALTATTPLKGGLGRAPRIAWSVDLGGPKLRSERLYILDPAGGARAAFLVLTDDAVTCRDARGGVCWALRGFPQPQVEDVRDYAGDGSSGILLTTTVAGRRDTFMVPAHNGKAVFLWRDENIFGGRLRFGKLLRGVKGAQIAGTCSGETPPAPWSGSIRLVSFADGLEKPRFHVRETLPGAFYTPLILIADMDADGRDELVIISYEQMWTFDTETGARKCHMAYSAQIRTYSSRIAALHLYPGDRCPSLVMVNPHIPGLLAARQDGKSSASPIWKVVAGTFEDQYQVAVQIGPGGRDLVYDMAGDGQLQVLASVVNEHGDRKTNLAVFDARTGRRLAEEPDAMVLSVEDLDTDGRPEVLLRQGADLRIARWTGDGFRDLWRGERAEPLYRPGPAEGNLSRSEGFNPLVWRESDGSERFLLRFRDGVRSCSLGVSGLRVGEDITVHAALGNGESQRRERLATEGSALVASLDGKEVYRYEPPAEQTYLAPPPLVADLGGERRVLVRHANGKLLWASPNGKQSETVIERLYERFQWHVEAPAAGPSVCDADGDGENEIVATVTDADGTPFCAIMDADGRTKRRIDLVPGASVVNKGPTGSLGPGRGRWIILRMMYGEQEHQGRAPAVVAFDCKSGQRLWLRDQYGFYGATPVKFPAHLPTAVADYDGDGVDDWIVCSENFYGVIDVTDNRDLVPPVMLSDTIPGHWTAYTYPVLGDISGSGKPALLHNGAHALALVTDLEGRPIWHYGMARDTSRTWGALADVDGDGKCEVIYAQPDGTIRCFEPAATDSKCPTCKQDAPLGPVNHAGHQRWVKSMGRPISRMAVADLDGDGRYELVFGGDAGRLTALGERAGKPRVLWSVAFARRVGEPIVAEVDGDGRTEILVPVEDGRLYCLKGSPRKRR